MISNFILIPGSSDLSLNGALWSLSYEFFYYLVFAAIACLWLGRNLKMTLIMLAISLFLPSIALIHNYPSYHINFGHVLNLAVIWFAGVLLAYCYIRFEKHYCLPLWSAILLFDVNLLIGFPYAGVHPHLFNGYGVYYAIGLNIDRLSPNYLITQYPLNRNSWNS